MTGLSSESALPLRQSPNDAGRPDRRRDPDLSPPADRQRSHYAWGVADNIANPDVGDLFFRLEAGRLQHLVLSREQQSRVIDGETRLVGSRVTSTAR